LRLAGDAESLKKERIQPARDLGPGQADCGGSLTLFRCFAAELELCWVLELAEPNEVLNSRKSVIVG